VLDAVMIEIDRHAEELAQIVVAEQGKTITEARGEVQGIKNFFRVAASNRYRNIGELVAPNQNGEHLIVREEPYGVVVAIIPWNFPGGDLRPQGRPRLMAGNAIVLKPSEVTPAGPRWRWRGSASWPASRRTGQRADRRGRETGDQAGAPPVDQVVTVTGSTGPAARSSRQPLTTSSASRSSSAARRR
jgi:lactaldehyde dehydrogenase/glycolaldehyde dehydrogenase